MKPAPIDPPQIHHVLWEGFSGQIGWDIGVNAGHTAKYMLEHWDRVVGFEPAEECWPTLDGFTAANPRFTLVKAAVSDKNGEVGLTVLPDKIDTGQLVTSDCHGMEWDTHRSTATLRKVPSITLDTAWRSYGRPDFMKIDVEGHELKVLIGARRTLAVQRPQLLIEFHTENLHKTMKQYLHGLGYDTRTIRHPHYQPGTDMWMTHGWMKCRVPEQACEPDR